MDITWYGHSCFRITQRNFATIVTDPYDHKVVGYSSLKLKSDVVTSSKDTPGHNHLQAVDCQKVLPGPGEYEIGGVFIQGIAMYDPHAENPHYNVVYVINYDGITVAHLGDLDHVPSQSEIENLGQIDVALVPVGGGSALNASHASEVISLIEPSVVVPMHYKTDYTSLDLDPVDRFLREMGVSNIEELEELDGLKVSSGGNLPEQTQVVVLAVKE